VLRVSPLDSATLEARRDAAGDATLKRGHHRRPPGDLGRCRRAAGDAYRITGASAQRSCQSLQRAYPGLEW